MRYRGVLVGLLVALPLALAGCDDRTSVSSAAPTPSGPAPRPLTLEITPATPTKGLPISTEVGTRVRGGTITTVRMTQGSTVIAGTMREDGSAWVPAQPLAYGKAYAVVVSAAGEAGQKVSKRAVFTTAPSGGGAELGSGLYLFSGHTYGVAMPVVAEFVPGIAVKDRARLERRMFVRSSPAQPGVWHWTASGTQAFYRPPAYWRPGTTLAVRLGLAGVRLSNGRTSPVDRSATVKIGRKLQMVVDNKTKRLTVIKNGRAVRKMAVSLGKPSTPSSSGTLVVMEKAASTIFDTRAELGPVNGYRARIAYAQRLTWGGEFIHSAPWSVGDQGYRNVSHGCVNVAPGNASWLFSQTMIGDPVTVTGTGVKVVDGNGWTVWSQSWSEYVKSSALPVPASLKSAGHTADAVTTQKVRTPRI